MRKTIIIFILQLSFSFAWAEIKLPGLISSNMVLQRNMPVNIWGTAEAGEKVTVSFNSQQVKCVAANDGRWKVVLKPMKAGGPYKMYIKGSNTIVLDNILLGDVWICSGQSNMQMPLAEAKNAGKEIADAHNNQIRFFKVPVRISEKPIGDIELPTWQMCTPETAEDFSATGFFFGRELQPQVNVPIGLIESAVGGTLVESWTDTETISGFPEYADSMSKLKTKRFSSYAESCNPNDYPTLLYNAMIHPLTNQRIKGVIWYQGEANVRQAYRYRNIFASMIRGWRKSWNQGDFPFLFVQLTSFDSGGMPDDGDWAMLRESQSVVASAVPNSGMVVTIDIGESHDVHPKNKQDVGSRLAMVALEKVYNRKINSSAPVFKSMEIGRDSIVVNFDYADSGFLFRRYCYGRVMGFEVAGLDRVFHSANAVIDRNSIVLKCREVKEPVAVRYGWMNDPYFLNLFGRNGMPVAPFRTDDW